ncbi:MAG: DUF2293 domain-containing protein [Reichenbachiella sp.]
MKELRLMSPGTKGHVINEFGIPEKPPQDWVFVPAGDAALTRKITAKGPSWRVQVKKGRRLQSLGIWAPQTNMSEAKTEVLNMRTAPDYEKKKASAAKSRDKKQAGYSLDFEDAVRKHLNFHLSYETYEATMARLVTEHAIPVGSGTVARTVRIPIEERASKAVIAWMRHQTTNYDQMKIARIKGERRAVRRQLAERSVDLLVSYRNGHTIHEDCPLMKALTGS